MNIRPYETADWGVVRDLWNRGKFHEFRDTCDMRAIIPLERDEGMHKLFRDSTIFVGEADGQIVGFAGFKEEIVTWLFVDPDCYRKGYGSALLSFILSRMGPTVRLNVGAGNASAIALYRKHGFRITKRFSGNHNGYPTKAIRMVRTSH